LVDLNQISNFTKIHPVQAELFHAGARTDGHDEANTRLQNVRPPC